MRPSLPIELPEGSKLIEIADHLDCSMLRFGSPCNNDAHWVFVCPDPQGGCHRLIGVCQMCIEDSDDDWIQAVERTCLGVLR